MGVRKRRFKLIYRISYVGVEKHHVVQIFSNLRHRMARECIVAIHVVCVPILLLIIGGQPS